MLKRELEPVARAICNGSGYAYIGAVGEGAFKETFEAREGDTRHALKVYRPKAVSERVEREIGGMLRCNHPNIARLRRVDQLIVEGRTHLYSVEEFLSGGTLIERTRDRGLFATDETREIGRMLISAVAHIASKGLVHRDIKPENIMLRDDGHTPVIVDFGLVRTLDETSLTATWAQRGPGTPYFAPPEQLRNEKQYIDWRCDQFSLGVSLAVVTLGRHPYHADDDDRGELVVTRVADRQPVPASFVEKAAAAGLPVLARMVAPWPVQRYRTPEALLVARTDQQRDRP